MADEIVFLVDGVRGDRLGQGHQGEHRPAHPALPAGRGHGPVARRGELMLELHPPRRLAHRVERAPARRHRALRRAHGLRDVPSAVAPAPGDRRDLHHRRAVARDRAALRRGGRRACWAAGLHHARALRRGEQPRRRGRSVAGARVRAGADGAAGRGPRGLGGRGRDRRDGRDRAARRAAHDVDRSGRLRRAAEGARADALDAAALRAVHRVRDRGRLPGRRRPARASTAARSSPVSRRTSPSATRSSAAS